MARPQGVKPDQAYEAAYWRAFEKFFGPQNGPVVKAMLLARYPPGEAGATEVDRVGYGLRQTMGWVADAIERAATGRESPSVPQRETNDPPRARR